MALKWKTANYQTSALTCAYCHKAVLAGQQYRMGSHDSEPTVKVAIHKICYEIK